MAFLDTSILGSYYCEESLSEAVNQALKSIPFAVISPLVEAEFMSLLSLKLRKGDLKSGAAEVARREFRKHKVQSLYRLAAIDDRACAVAARWLGRFDTPLRTLDAVHLATAHLHHLKIWTTDRGLAASAHALRVPFELIQ